MFIVIFILFLRPIDASHSNETNLQNFVCSFIADELQIRPELRSLAFIENEHNFSSSFSRELLKCLPTDVSKVILFPYSSEWNKNFLISMKPQMLLYIEPYMVRLKNKRRSAYNHKPRLVLHANKELSQQMLLY